MNISILNEEYGISSCNNEDIPESITKIGPAQNVAFFYCKKRDRIVLNKDNVNYNFYKVLIESYFLLDNERKRDCMKVALKEDRKAYIALCHINWIIRVRRKLYKSMRRKVGKTV